MSQILVGTPEVFNTHMRGLELMIKAIGGLKVLEKTNPQLYGMIAW
jgi:hypothetical protein